MLVPSSERFPAEHLIQGYAGTVIVWKAHRLNLGAYIRNMDNLVYSKDAKKLFNSTMSFWEDATDTGKGHSKGIEAYYEFTGKELHVRLSATLAKSSRWGFEKVNGGKSFHAPFDRGYMTNLSMEWKRIYMSFICQGGNWVNGAPAKYYAYLPGTETPLELEYYSNVNNHQMPALIRLDAGYRIEWMRENVSRSLQLGVFNLLNRFNPFTVYYDTEADGWKELALFRIMPNITYRVSF